MKQFWKDYWELCKESGRFCKKHWKGYIILNAAIIGAELAWYKYKTEQIETNLNCSTEEEEAQ